MPATITVPVRATALAGHHDWIASIRVFDTGNAPAAITASVQGRYTINAQRFPLPSGTRITVSPDRFTLAAGSSRNVKVTLNVPKGTTGARWADVAFTGRASHHGVAVTGGAATQLEVPIAGAEPAPKAVTAHTVPPAAPGSFPWLLVVLAVIVGLAVIGGTSWGLKRTRKRQLVRGVHRMT